MIGYHTIIILENKNEKINPTSDINATKSNRTGRNRGKERKGRKKTKINLRKSSETTTPGRNTSGAEPAKAAIIVCKQCVQAKPVSKWVQGGRDVY